MTGGADNLRRVRPGDPLSASQARLVNRLLKREVTGPNVYADATGWHLRPSPEPDVIQYIRLDGEIDIVGYDNTEYKDDFDGGPFIKGLLGWQCDADGNPFDMPERIMVKCPWPTPSPRNGWAGIHGYSIMRRIVQANSGIPFLPAGRGEVLSYDNGFGADDYVVAGHIFAPEYLGSPLPVLSDELIGRAMRPWYHNGEPDLFLSHSIPTGWRVCNGSAGVGKNGEQSVPDMRGRFPVALGASLGAAPVPLGGQGGNLEHNHGVLITVQAGSGGLLAIAHPDGLLAANHIPPYHGINYIMWVGITGYGA